MYWNLNLNVPARSNWHEKVKFKTWDPDQELLLMNSTVQAHRHTVLLFQNVEVGFWAGISSSYADLIRKTLKLNLCVQPAFSTSPTSFQSTLEVN